MAEEERLELRTTVEDDFTDDLAQLQADLEVIDEQIRDTGRGRDHIGIDVEAYTGDAVADLTALEGAIETFDDDITIETDVEDTDFDETDDIIRASDLNDTADEGGDGGVGDFEDVDIETASVNIDAANVDVDAATSTNNEIFDSDETIFSDLDDLEIASVLDMESGFSTYVPTEDQRPSPDASGDVGELMTGGGKETTVFETNKRQRDLWGVEMPQLEDVRGADDAFFPSDRDNRGFWRRLRSQVDDLELEDFRYTMGKFHQNIADLIPLVAIYVGALPAVITALGGLATAAIGATAALAGVGVLGAAGISLSQTGELSMDPIMDELSAIADSFIEAFGPLAQSLAPTIQQALGEIQAMAGPLADASQGLLLFRDEFTGLFEWIGRTLPSVVNDFLAFAHAAEPILTMIVGAFADFDWFRFFAAQIADLIPYLMTMADGIRQMLPVILQLSRGFLMVASGLTWLIGGVAKTINLLGPLGEIIGLAAGGFMMFSVAAAIAQGRILGFAVAAGVDAVKSLTAFIWTENVATVTTWQFWAALTAVLGTITLGLALLPSLTSAFGNLGGSIGDAADNLERFAGKKNALNSDFGGGGGYGTSANGVNVYNDQSKTVIYAGDQDDAARQQYSSNYEKRQHRDAVFGSG